jgi:membrane protein DedA with SNARE-associated domain
MLDSIVNLFTAYVSYWPLASFFILLLAGFNIPVSEDAVIILSAGVAFADRSLIIPNWVALYAGIIVSDIMVYWLGYFVSKGLFQFKAIRKKLTPKKIRLVAKALDDYGFRTFIVVRFIPFGARNALWMSSGFVRLPFRKFVLYDSIAALISCSLLYNLVLFMGAKASLTHKIIGVALFLAMIAFFACMIVKVVRKETEFFDEEDSSIQNKSSETQGKAEEA